MIIKLTEQQRKYLIEEFEMILNPESGTYDEDLQIFINNLDQEIIQNIKVLYEGRDLWNSDHDYNENLIYTIFDTMGFSMWRFYNMSPEEVGKYVHDSEYVSIYRKMFAPDIRPIVFTVHR